MSINDCVEMTMLVYLMFFYLCKNARFQRYLHFSFYAEIQDGQQNGRKSFLGVKIVR